MRTLGRERKSLEEKRIESHQRKMRKRHQKIRSRIANNQMIIFREALVLRASVKDYSRWVSVAEILEENSFDICKVQPSFYAKAFHMGVQIIKNLADCSSGSDAVTILNYEVYGFLSCLEQADSCIREVLEEENVRGTTTRLKLLLPCVNRCLEQAYKRLNYHREQIAYIAYFQEFMDNEKLKKTP